MPRQFLIVNNGMTDLRGHYYENGLAIAEAAAERGFRVGLATFAECDLTNGDHTPPDWLDLYPVMRVNHWGNKIAQTPAGVSGLRGSLAALRAAPSFDAVLDGTATMQQYLEGRFTPMPEEPPVPVVSPRSRAKTLLKRYLPPVVTQPAGWLYRRRQALRSLARTFAPPALVAALRRPASPPPAQPVVMSARLPALPDEDRIAACLNATLDRINVREESELTRTFQCDLDRFLCLADAGPDDHVYLPTAHGREALAACRLAHELGSHSPTFHLEFRHAVGTLDEIEADIDDPFLRHYTLVHQAFFDAVRGYPNTGRVRLYTDTAELASDYAALSGLPFDVLPIPFRIGLIPQGSPFPGEPLRVLFLGDVRREKGFLHLPKLVRAMHDDYLQTGRVKFVIQATLHPDETDPELRTALAELSTYPSEQVELVGRDGFLGGPAYYQLLADADVALCPYRAESYRARSSGVLVEAILAGKPTVVPAGTWLANQQPAGTGEAFTDAASFQNAVRMICDNHAAYRERARAAQAVWSGVHTPGRLVEQLVGQSRLAAAA